MARMFVEGVVGSLDSDSEAAQILMRELDDEATREGMAVSGDVEISEVESALVAGRVLRLEAEVEPR